MKCFYDTTQDAIGTCKSCGKGLSADYAVDLGKGLACRGLCEDDVRGLIALIDNNVAMRAASERIVRGSGGAGIAGSVAILLMGCGFLYTGLHRGEAAEPFPVAMGALFILWGLVGLRRSFAIQRALPREQDRNA